ncbi:MAG: DEAD/DEAH box helicase family protein [Sandaracinaceae bacterium]|nr:DEAD/DEAH box helicase family protein [Sandaracinaceae bacterium]
MKSVNFEFLRARRAVLAELAGFAERYAHEDPASSLIKQRSFVEHAVAAIYASYRLRPPYSDNLNDLMNETAFRQAVPEVVQNKLHAVRKAGNHAAHPRRPITSQLSLECLTQLFDIARWFFVQVDGGELEAAPKYVPPPPVPSSGAKTKDALEKLRLAEAKYESVLAGSTKRQEAARGRARRHRATRTQEHARAARTRARRSPRPSSSTSDHAPPPHRPSAPRGGLERRGRWQNTEQVRQEVQLSTMPTPSGDGFADYVLYGDDGKPLAVIEAKKTAKDAQQGGEQARMYADALEKATGVRPVVFFTNGIDVFLWDDAQKYPYRKVYGFYSKDSLEYLVHQRVGKKALAHVEPNLAIANRMYQLEAVKRVTERFESKFRKALVVQATGTGKTRVAISLCDVLMRAGWVKRILFLCDRKELRRQADRVFKEFMPGEPRVVVGASTANDRDKRIYLATYPAMMKAYEDFDVGFFDLIIADESHRSIYKKFRSLFQYFDALEVGLTATPVKFIERNTYELFACENGDPTSHFSSRRRSSPQPPTSCRSGCARSAASSARGLPVRPDERGAARAARGPGQTRPQPSTTTARTSTSTSSTRTRPAPSGAALMDEGIREATGSHVGKTIVFARSHLHAVHLAEVFSELYPQYGSAFCRVIDNQEPRPTSSSTTSRTRERAHHRHLRRHARHRHRRARGGQPRLRQAGQVLREVLADDRPRHAPVQEPVRPGQGQDRVPDLRPLVQLLVLRREVQGEAASAAEVAPPAALRGAPGARRRPPSTRWTSPCSGASSSSWATFARCETPTPSTPRQVEGARMLADGDRVHHFAAATKADLLSIAAPSALAQHPRRRRRLPLRPPRDPPQLELLKGGPRRPGCRTSEAASKTRSSCSPRTRTR